MTENESIKELCQRETFILGPSLWQTGIDVSRRDCHATLCSTHGLHSQEMFGVLSHLL